jgi:4-hydroxybenzoate polyprenyltransferase
VRLRNRLAALAQLVRLPNGLVAAAAVFVGGRWAGTGWSDGRVILAAISAMGLSALANAHNDFQDRHIDAYVHPERPIPSGAIPAGWVPAIIVVAGVLGVATALAARPELGVLSVAVAVTMLAYSGIKERSGLAGNLVVTVIGSLPFLYGAWAAGNAGAAVPLMALAAPLQFGREVAKDIDDEAGDWEGERPTLPIRLGLTAAQRIAAAAALVALLVLAVIAVRLPLVIGVSLLPAVLIVLFGCWQLLRGGRIPRSNVFRPSNAFKLGMVLAIAAMLPAPR